MTPSAPPTLDLSVKRGDLVAVLTKFDPAGHPSEWWRCRSRDGRVGYLPGVYLEEVKRPSASTSTPATSGAPNVSRREAIEEAGRVNTLTSVLNENTGHEDGDLVGVPGGGERAQSLKVG